MFASVLRAVIVIAALLMAVTSASAQGYTVRTWGYYDPVPYGPVVGATYSFSPYRPTVMLHDPWGRVVDMPLQPKVLYYGTPFWTPEGWYRPTSIAVMPDSRPPASSAPARRPEPIPPAALPTFRYDGGPANPVPDVAADRPAVIPTVPAERPVPKAGGPGLPPIPKVPELPDVPKAPGKDAGPAVPKLGPTPMEIPPGPRPGK